MKSARRSMKRSSTARLTGLITTCTLLIGGGWCLLMLFATAIGTKAPSGMEMLALVWPALAGGVLAIAALVFLRRDIRFLPILFAVAGLVILVAGIRWIWQ